MAIFRATLDSLSVVLNGKEQVIEAADYLAEWLATVATLVDKSPTALVAFYDAIPRGEGGRQRGLRKTLLFDIA